MSEGLSYLKLYAYFKTHFRKGGIGMTDNHLMGFLMKNPSVNTFDSKLLIFLTCMESGLTPNSKESFQVLWKSLANDLTCFFTGFMVKLVGGIMFELSSMSNLTVF